MITIAVGLLAVVVCVAVNAFFVAAEFALVTIRHTWIEELVQEGHPSAAAVKSTTEHLDDSIAATQLGITVASIALGWLGEPAIAQLVEPLLTPLLPHWHRAAAHTIATVFAFSGITVLHVVLGELAPKAVALGTPERVAMLVARPLLLFQRVFRPIVWAMNTIGNRIVKKFGYEPASGHERVHSVGELKMLVAETQGAGDLDPTQADVVSRTLEITLKRVRDVMLPIERTARLEVEMTDQEILDVVLREQYSRMPVYSRAANRWEGIANTKLIMRQYLLEARIDLEAAMYIPAIFHHAAPLLRVLRTFKRRHQHMALVASDVGEKIGVVTLEDVLEQLVGAIDDELDETPADVWTDGAIKEDFHRDEAK